MPSTIAAIGFAAAAVFPAVFGQFVTAPQNLTLKKGAAGINVRYKEVPTGICELDPNVKSYSGYADVAEDQHIFWWFFEARNQDPTMAPLTVWINGGPGSSSMIGLFQENGPCGIDSNGTVYSNPYSWNNASNMLFIDQPTQVGFSYSIPVPAYTSSQGDIVALPNATCPDYASDCGTYSYPNLTLTANSTDAAAPNFWKTLQGFVGAFPEYAQNGFHFTTESYGGHYAPVFSEYIERQNAALPPAAVPIDLRTVLIGNGWFDPLTQYEAYYRYAISPGNPYDLAPLFNASVADQWHNNLYGPGNCLDQTRACYASGENAVCASADSFCATEVENLFDIYAGRDEYDVRELVPDPFPYSFYVDYLNTPTVQAAIGAYVNFSESNAAVSTAFSATGDDDRRVSSVEDVVALLARNVSVTLYFGDADYNCNYLGGLAVAEQVGAAGYGEAGFADLHTSDGVVHGQVRQAGSFAFVRVYESGHEVPFYQPVAALELFERAIGGRDLAVGKEVVGEAYRTVGEKESTYREGNGTVVWEVLPEGAKYNTTTNRPDGLKRGKRAFKPRFH